MKKAAAITLFILEQDTEHFSFRAFGRSAEECRELMVRALRRHCQQTGADENWLGSPSDWSPVMVSVPSVLRDGSEYL